MSMPTKGKHHHLSQHQYQTHHSHLQSQHILGVNINQTSPAPHTSHAQHYNPGILSNTPRFVTHSGSDFHVSGQNFVAQSGGQVGGGGGTIGVPGARGPPLGGLQLIGQNTTGISSGISSSGQPQSTPGSTIQSQVSQGPAVASSTVHNPSPEMGKQTHLQTQPSMQQVYNQSSSRSGSQQTYYSPGPRPQQQRNISHRSGQTGNQSQVVGMPGVGASSAQPTAIYPHPSIALQHSTMFVQSQVSGIHNNPQQNVYSMNSQMPMQYSGPPQRHQTHQNQFQYQSYQTHPIITASNLFGFTHGAQHAGFFYHQPQSTQINLNRAGTSTVAPSSSHLSGTLNSQALSQGTLQQQTQPQQTLHTMSLQIPQNDQYQNLTSNTQTELQYKDSVKVNVDGVPETSVYFDLTNQAQNNVKVYSRHRPDVYTGFNGVSSLSARTKKPRTKAITDIVNPNTGKNISAEIYEDDATAQSGESSNRESPQSLNCSAELVVADFAARVAKLASESTSSTSLTDAESSFENPNFVSPNSDHVQTCPESISKNQCNINSATFKDNTPLLSVDVENSNSYQTDTQSEQKAKATVSINPEPILSDNILNNASSLLNLDRDQIQSFSESDRIQLSSSLVMQSSLEIKTSENENVEDGTVNAHYLGQEGTDSLNNEIISISENIPSLLKEQQDNGTHYKAHEGMKGKNVNEEYKTIELCQKTTDGKTMQKQKSKNKAKCRDLNRKGLEKEGTDMDTFINPVQVSTSSINIDNKHDENSLKDIKKEESAEPTTTKDIKEKDNFEFKNEKDNSEINNQSLDVTVSSVDIKDKILLEEKDISEKNIHNNESTIEKSLIAITNDVVDHVTFYKTNVDKEIVPPIVAQKNEENSKVSGVCNISKDSEACTSALNVITTSSSLVKSVHPLKYTYSEDQWSPINTDGKKVYGREFLMKLQHDPSSRIKPSNLPDLDVVLKDNIKIRAPVDLRYKDTNLNRHDSLFPGFVKSSSSAKVIPSSKKSYSGKPNKPSKSNMIHVSLPLREDVKLRETENAWKPTRLVQGSLTEEQAKTEALYKRVRSVLNKLTPQKFGTLVNQVRELMIDTQERLQGVIDLVFEKAVDEPNFSVEYALMCKELSNMKVTGGNSEDSSSANFRKLILTRCQTEFEKNTVLTENARREKLKEIEECPDPERKKELQIILEEEERRIRVKSVGNIRFIGELFKQNMLSTKIMNQCIQHLINQIDEENLECLCKLLTTIGKVLESKQDLSNYFKQLQVIADDKGKISSRIRFMLQDVIDLRKNKWVPRRDDSNPKTIDQIQREAENERLDIQLNNSSLNTPRKDDRIYERKRNRGGAGSIEDGGWIHHIGRTRISVETAKLKNKPPSVDDMLLGSRSHYQWSKPNPKMTTPNKFCCLENVTSESDKRVPTTYLSGSRSTGPREYGRLEFKSNYDVRGSRNGNYNLITGSYNRDNPTIESSRSQSLSLMPSKSSSQTAPIVNLPELSEDQLQTAINTFLKDFITEEGDVQEAVKTFRSTFPASSHVLFVHVIINAGLEKSDYHRNKTSKLLSQLLSHKCINLSHFKTGLVEILEGAGELIIDIPKLWKYFAKILVHPVISDTKLLSELKTIIQTTKLRNEENVIELIAELLVEMQEIKNVDWVIANWVQTGLQWSDFIDNRTKIDQVITKYKLEHLVVENQADFKTENTSLSMVQIQEMLFMLLKSNNLDDIYSWIETNVGEKVKEPKFIQALMTAILETSVEQCNDKWVFKVENFDKLQNLIQRYVDADDYLELQCLFAVQAYINKIKHPAGLLLKIMTHLCENNVVSNEAFLAWEKNDDPAEREGKSVSLLSLKSFFIPLKEVEDMSSGEDP